MAAHRSLCFVLGISLITSVGAHAADDYPADPDSKRQEGVPQGELIKRTFDQSKIFPGTTREVTIYVPRQYDGSKPACVYVNQDGVQWNAPTVFDNLIHKEKMPVTIGVFVMHGRVKALDEGKALDRYNRSLEYDGLGPDYATFLLTELLPWVEQQTTSDGRAIRLSSSGNDRAIGGSSSGAICAFTTAWERPDSFSRVFSAIGTYVGLRGGDRYHTLLRKFEPRPLRIFLQDGSGDLNIYGGDWWMANQTIQRSLEFAGYDHEHVWGEGGHNGKHGTALFPRAMRYLWKDWPKPVSAGISKNGVLRELLRDGGQWEMVSKPDGSAASRVTSLVVNAGGEVSSATDRQIGGSKTKAERLVVDANGNSWATESAQGSGEGSKVWFIPKRGEPTVVDTGLKHASGIALSTDQSLLYVADAHSHWVFSYQIQPDGSLAHKQRYYWLHVPDTADDSGAGGMTVDAAGRLYVATRMGVQVCDQAGRVNAILPVPNGTATDVAFGGAGFDTLYVAAGERIYRRKLNTKGAPSFLPPIKPEKPRL